jgi:hypothetical protein
MSDTSAGVGPFSVKLVGAHHFAFPFCGVEGNPALMNFPDSPEGRRLVAAVPLGHRALVYLMHPVMRFGAAIEYIKWDDAIEDVLKEGQRAAVAQGAVAMLEALNPRFAKLWRCIRILALIDDPRNALTPDFDFHEGDVMPEISEQEYREWYDAIPWTWTAEGL